MVAKIQRHDIPVTFNYRNHRGITETRTIDFERVEYLRAPGYGYDPGWFVSGFCHDRKARRSFAFDNIILDENASFASYVLIDNRR